MTRFRESEPPMPDPLGYFITWSTYGTWLPGDERGWVEYRRGWQLPAPMRELEAMAKMTEDACRLDPEQRELVHRQVAETCRIRGWELSTVNCRSNHAHAILATRGDPKLVRSQLKSWCTRRLKELDLARQQGIGPVRENWWAERGSQRFINNENGLEAATLYVRDCQDRPRPF